MEITIRTPSLSAVVMRVSAFAKPEAFCIASATLAAERSVRQIIVDPEPLRNPPRAPAFSAALAGSSKGDTV